MVRAALAEAVAARIDERLVSADLAGLDSTTLACLATQHTEVAAVTFADERLRDDDLAYAARTASTVPSLTHHTVPGTEDTCSTQGSRTWAPAGDRRAERLRGHRLHQTRRALRGRRVDDRAGDALHRGGRGRSALVDDPATPQANRPPAAQTAMGAGSWLCSPDKCCCGRGQRPGSDVQAGD
ncbi:asparagine synthase-related protein [Streptomyces cinnamoneus]|uniref:asparagine synthase-related protein n=1 Tax=Streptomyces cinnamoneus TaxID=53446 RepID=UPI0034404FF6